MVGIEKGRMSNNPFDGLAKLTDVFFNGRPSDAPKKAAVSIDQIIKRGVSHVAYNGKIYRIEATEATVVPKTQGGSK